MNELDARQLRRKKLERERDDIREGLLNGRIKMAWTNTRDDWDCAMERYNTLNYFLR